jgi:hypothetical protein
MVFGRRKSGSARVFSWAPEVMVITAAAPVLGSLVNPADPYMLHSPFPWLMLAPLAVALQHGLWAGLTSTAILSGLAGWQAMSAGAVPASFASWSIGCALTALIAGQIRDSVRGRTEKLAERADHLQDRLERSERSRHLVQLSHAKLEERVVSHRTSLAAAIDDAERRIGEGHSMQELGQILLDVLATQGHLHSASLYVAARDHGLLLSEPVASFGGTGASSSQHPLVVRAFTTAKLAAIVDGLEAARNDTTVLAAVPLITARRRTVGVVAIHQMPFMMFHAEHLNQVFVLAGHLADLLFDRWTEVHTAPQLGLAVDEAARVKVLRPAVLVEAVVGPALVVNQASADAGTPSNLVVRSVGALRAALSAESAAAGSASSAQSTDVSGVHAMDVTEHVTVSGVHAAANVASVTISNAHAASDSVSVSGARAERIEILLSPDAPAPVVAAESAANQTTMHMTDDTSFEISVTIELDEPTPEVIERAAVRAAEPTTAANVVAVFEPGCVVAHESIAFDEVSAEKSRKNTRTAEITKSRKGSRAVEAASVESNAAVVIAPAVAQAATSEISSENTRASETASVGAREATPRARENTRAAQYLRTNARAAQSTTYEASRITAPVAHARESVQHSSPAPVEGSNVAVTPAPAITQAATVELSRENSPAAPESARPALPAPVENARTAILAAFARKANAEDSQALAADAALPPSPRTARAAFGGYRPVSADLFRAPRQQPKAAGARNSHPVTASPAKAAPSAPPAKAEDARASVRAAFAKRTPAAAEEETTLTQTAEPGDAAAAIESTREHAHSGAAVSSAAIAADSARAAAARPFDEMPAATGLSIEQARDAMLATLAKVRVLPRKRSTGRAAAVSRKSASEVERSTTAKVATPANHAEVAHAPVAAPHAPATKRQSASRTTLLPPPPAPAGFAAVKTVAQPPAEPRSRTQPTRPLNGSASRSTSV